MTEETSSSAADRVHVPISAYNLFCADDLALEEPCSGDFWAPRDAGPVVDTGA